MMRYLLAFLAIATTAMAQDKVLQDNGLQFWGKIFEVFSHPRCSNCHVGPDNLPMWSGPSYGPKARPHGMNIDAGPSRIGMETIPCNACHTLHNSMVPHGPPGAEVWLLPPVEMQWSSVSSADICAQIKDRNRNGERSIADVVEHVEHNGLVGWGWDPGPGREPAPYSNTQLAQFLKQWDAAGAPCPAK